MKRFALYIVLSAVFAGLSSCGAKYDARTLQAFGELDRKLDERQAIERRKDGEIDCLRQNVSKAGGIVGKYEALDSLFDAYRLYNIDSTVYYAYKKENVANATRDRNLIVDAKLDIIRMNAISGLYVEALEGLSSIDTVGLPKRLRRQYAESAVSLYESMSEIYVSHPERAAYVDKLTDSRIALIELCDSDDVNILYQEMSLALQTRTALASSIRKLSDRLDNDTALAVHDKAILSYLLSLAYKAEGNGDEALVRMIQSAEFDVSTPVREHKSLYELSAMLYERGDIERAHKYLSRSVDDLFMTKARVQMQSMGRLLPLITLAYNDKKEADRRKLENVLIATAVISVLLVVALVGIYKGKKKSDLLKAKEQEANVHLNETNGRLSALNQKLIESDKIKEMYIGQYINMCSSYIDRVEKYRNNLLNIARTKSAKELVDALKSSSHISSELSDFYYSFDRSFLHLYPDFVEKFNALLREECRFDIKPGRPLNTELRVFALIRLGITDSNRIAEFLRRSVSTVYNYRVKMRNAAIADRDDFEFQVQNLCKND